MTTGLTLGKFAPLHKGHELLIQRGLEETERMVVMIYDCPDTTNIPLMVRARWILAQYPQVDLIEAWGGPAVVGDTPEIRKLNEDYIIKKLGSRKITHFYSSEFYGKHVSERLGAIDRRVDPDRGKFPVSGTAARDDAFACREHLSPIVYRDLVNWVVFLGAPSTGKSTLAEALAQRLNTTWMPEYGREYWDAHQQERRLTPAQLIEIAKGHREREERAVLNANRHLFIDTDATTTRMFCDYYHGSVPAELEAFAGATLSRYDLFFLCEDDIPYDDTWDRSGEVNRTVFQQRIRADLDYRRIPYISLRGDLEPRIQTVSRILEGFDKYEGHPANPVL